MGLFKSKPSYYEIGRYGTPEQFAQLLQNSKANPGGYYETDRRDLVDGALRAFHEGRPENIQMVVANPEAVKSQRYHYVVPGVLLKLTEGSSDKLAVIIRALEKVPAEDQQKTLNNALNEALMYGIGDEPFFAALLKSGANANVKVGGYAGGLLAAAACYKHPVSVIKLLHDNGASFEDALHGMHLRGHQTPDIDRLKHYQEKVTGKPAVAAEAACQPGMDKALVALLETVLHMQEQLVELTKKVDRLSAPMPAANTNAKEPAVLPQKGTALKFPKR